ncbi:MAG TPA: sialate O-acetylesterase [Asticcacaulis sp.]|nr:sialate O-acetylesterase [Asticcacaulis sp.]
MATRRRDVIKTACAAGLLACLAAPAVHAETLAPPRSEPPRFASIFSDHAVLQRDEAVNVWGTATAGQTVTVSLDKVSVTVSADNQGAWQAKLPAQPAGGPHMLSAADASGAATTLHDIDIGDVFLCGGQSNMQFPARLSTGAWGDIPASTNTNIRFLTVPTYSASRPQTDLRQPAQWRTAAPETTADASAVCYYMAKEIEKDQRIPVGFIGSYWGGTTIQGWISQPALGGLAAYRDGVDAITQYAADPRKAMEAQYLRQEAWWDKHFPAQRQDRRWAKADFDDSGWKPIEPSGSWKTSGIEAFRDFEGVAWFRTKVMLTAQQAQTANALVLGPIDTYESTWVNGTWIGSTGMSWQWRDYTVPAGIFKPGLNIIAVRVLGAGGMTGDPKDRAIKTTDGQSIPVAGTWAYKIAAPAKPQAVPAVPWAVPVSLSTLYNGMIAPIEGYNIKLVAWYQGEANAYDGKEYQTLLPLLMADWRRAFGKPDLPFLVAQLASYGAPSTEPGKADFADLREAQRLTIDRDPHAALITTFDLGDRFDIHPSQKAVVGARFARAARALAYGQDISPGGPEAISVVREGANLIVKFRYAQGRLLTYSSNQAIGFEVCSEAAHCTYAPALVEGDSIVLPNANRPEVTRVRYAWSDAPFANLFNLDDLPAVPFELRVEP